MSNKYYSADYKIPNPEDLVIEGAGCFPAGTMVFTKHGWKQIERIKKGELVIAFDKFGVLEHGIVTSTSKHTRSANTSGLYTFTFKDAKGVDDTLTVTGNHAIFIESEETHFKMAAEFAVGEVFEDQDGNKLIIETITKVEYEALPDDFVSYNFEVYPQHTYIVSDRGDHSDLLNLPAYVGLKVHNGGGGKSSSSTTGAVEDPNTLQSDNVIRVLEVISEGQCVGLTTGDAQSIYFNNTPVQNSDASLNFTGVVFDTRVGLPSQSVMNGFPAVEALVSINTQIKTTNPVTQQLDADADCCNVIIQLPNGLHFQDTTTGDLHGSVVQLAIDTRITNGTWTQYSTPTIDGKTLSPYQVAYRVPAPAVNTQWQVRVRRITADSTDANLVQDTYLYAVTQITSVQLPYNNTAYVGLTLDAKTVGNTVPTRSYDWKGIICQVPSNYNPVTRTYTGTWNGTLTSGWTDNPAWITYDMLTNTRYGMGNYIDVSTIDLSSFYNAGVFNDALVSDGYGGTEPRFTFNMLINTRDTAWKVIQQIAGSMRAVIMPGSIITLLQDRPDTPVRIVTNANVKDGLFTYTGSPLQTRNTAANVTWNDKDNYYLPTVTTYQDNAGIARYGFTAVDITAYGATTQGQAQRFGHWTVDTEINQTESVVWSAGFNQCDVEPGDIVEIMDNDYNTGFWGGKIVSSPTVNTVTLDRTVTLKAGSTYTFSYMSGDMLSVISLVVVTGPSTTNTLTLNSGSIPDRTVFAGHEWTLSSPTDTNPRQFRIQDIKETNPGEFQFSAIFYDPNKYARVEGGYVAPTPPYSNVSTTSCSAPTGITFTALTKNDPVQGPQFTILVGWDQPADATVVEHRYIWRKDNGNWTSAAFTSGNSFEIANAAAGVYEVQVSALNIAGVLSPITDANFTFGYAGNNTLLAPSAVTLVAGHGTGQNWTGNDLYVQWTPNAQNVGMLNQTVGGYHIQVVNNDQAVILGNYTVDANTTQFEYSYTDNVNQNATLGFAPCRDILIHVWTQDAYRSDSTTSVSGLFHHPAPPAPAMTLLSDGNAGCLIDFVSTGDTSGIAGYAGYWSDSSSLTISNGTAFSYPAQQIGSGIGSPTVVLPPYIDIAIPMPANADLSLYGATFYFIGAAYDAFSSDPTGLNFTSVIAVNLGPQYVAAQNIINGAVTASKLAAGAVGAAALNVPALDSNGNLAANSVGNSQIANSAVTAAKTSLAAINSTTGAIATGAVGTLALAANAVTAAKTSIAAIDPTSGNLVANSVTSTNIVSGTIVASDIATGTITAAQIAGNTITANQIAAATITSVQIATNTITAANILAGTITADKLLVGSLSNLVPNGSWATNSLVGWSPDSATYWSMGAANQGVNGGATCVVVTSPGGTATINEAMYSTTSIPVNPGEFYNFSVWARTNVTDTHTYGYIIAKVLQKNGTYIFPTVGTAVTGTGYQQITGQYQVTATDVSIQMGVLGQFNNTGTSTAGAYVIFSNASGLQMSGATLIQPGSITTGQIAASTILGSNIAAGTITGSLIQAGTIAAGNLVAGSAVITGTAQIANGIIVNAHIQSLVASKITAGTLQAGVIYAGTISASQISATDLSSIRATTGNLQVTGQLNIGLPTASGDAWGVIVSEGKSWWQDGVGGFIFAHDNSYAQATLGAGAKFTFFEFTGNSTTSGYMRGASDQNGNFSFDLNTGNMRIQQGAFSLATSNVMIDTIGNFNGGAPAFAWYGPNFSVDSRNGTANFLGITTNMINNNAVTSIGAVQGRQGATCTLYARAGASLIIEVFMDSYAWGINQVPGGRTIRALMLGPNGWNPAWQNSFQIVTTQVPNYIGQQLQGYTTYSFQPGQAIGGVAYAPYTGTYNFWWDCPGYSNNMNAMVIATVMQA